MSHSNSDGYNKMLNKNYENNIQEREINNSLYILHLLSIHGLFIKINIQINKNKSLFTNIQSIYILYPWLQYILQVVSYCTVLLKRFFPLVLICPPHPVSFPFPPTVSTLSGQ